MRIDISQAWTTAQRLVNGFIAAVPRLLLAVVILLVFYGIGLLLRVAVRRLSARMARGRTEHRTLELALERVGQSAILVLGMLVAAAAAFPSFTPANLVSALGIGGVAIGFAFKDIFQNFLAGILLLVTRPFAVGDQICFRDYEGNVEQILTRATYLRTYDGRRVVIPNADLFTNSVTVNTAFQQRRMEYDFTLGYAADLEAVRHILLDVMKGAEGVAPDPKADVVVVGLAGGAMHLRARWWSHARHSDVLLARDRVLTEAKRRLLDAGVELR